MLKIRKKLAEKKEASKGIAKAGFTLIELLVVLAILAILVLLAAPRFLGYTKDAEVSAMQADAKVLANAALVYNVESKDAAWPVGDETKVTINGTEFDAFELDKGALEDSVQTLRNDFGDYALVAETVNDAAGNAVLQEGDIVHKGGVENRDKVKQHGVNEINEGDVFTVAGEEDPETP